MHRYLSTLQLRRNVTRFAERPQRHPTGVPNRDPRQRGMLQRHPEPRFRRNLQRSTHQIANDVGVTNHRRVRVALLLDCPVEVLPEGGLDPCVGGGDLGDLNYGKVYPGLKCSKLTSLSECRLDDGGSGRIGVPSISRGSSRSFRPGNDPEIIFADSRARVIVERTILSNLTPNRLR